MSETYGVDVEIKVYIEGYNMLVNVLGFGLHSPSVFLKDRRLKDRRI